MVSLAAAGPLHAAATPRAAPGWAASARRRSLSLLLQVGLCAFGAAGDLLQPVLPAIRLASLALAILFGLGLVLARLWPRCRLLPRLAAPLLLGCVGLAVVQAAAGGPRGLLVGRAEDLAPWQDRLLGLPPPPPWDVPRLRAALPAEVPRPHPASADEFLFNALLLRDRADAALPATALAEALRRATSPRPDALLLAASLMARPAAAALLAPVLADLPAEARTLLAALTDPDMAARIAALQAVLAERPGEMLALAALAQARIAASLPAGPTIATAARIAPAVAAFAEPARFAAFAAEFLDPRQALLIGQSVAQLGWTQEMAARRIAVQALVPPPEMPDQPILLRLIPPEPAQAVQVWQPDAAGWVTLPEMDAAPDGAAATLRMPRPFRPRQVRLRYLDRDGTASAETVYAFEPAEAIRDRAQRRLERQGAFALYQPGWITPGQLNPLPLSGLARAGLQAVEWRTDADARPHRVPVALPDAALLAGEMPRILVPLPAQEGARLLILTPVYADGSRGEGVGLPIR